MFKGEPSSDEYVPRSRPSSIKLTAEMKNILIATEKIIYNEEDSGISPKDIADYLGKPHVTVENDMETMSIMGYLQRHQIGGPLVFYTMSKSGKIKLVQLTEKS